MESRHHLLVSFSQADEADAAVSSTAGIWTAYTPLWTAVDTAPVLGNGTLVGKSVNRDSTRFFWVKLTWGTTTTGGTGAWRFSLPAAPATDSAYVFSAGLTREDETYMATAQPVPGGSTVAVFADGAPGGVTFDMPFEFASGNSVRIAGVYEAL